MAADVIVPLSRSDLYRPLLLLATVLALSVVGLGAYVRLTDAGLGCPDWPGCYGHLLVPDHADDIGRAWREMIHRYAAGSLGLLILALTFAAWQRPQSRFARPWLETGLCGLVVIQALLGMWTVTELLKPVIVTAHLLGGMLSWAVLIVLCRREYAIGNSGKWQGLGAVTAATVLGQIILGGWVSSHYAGLACPDFPACQGSWWPDGAAASIHWVHRLGAIVVLAIVGTYAFVLLRTPTQRPFGLTIAAALVIQLALGISNVLFRLPLSIGVFHNLGAALLLATVAVSLTRKRT
ncbi:Heme A synthase, cytochrome oxidase biogenesis protein Cox15-CtaA [Georgfuchsia toluolica]|uniref:Heme A synthase, cytochrome oxidase biogenesis protein Cox15-CtaA n=1 Tax=Georgfuchsia toluolica TaxID=424218 RepID=A0A916N2E7_9PROT|nr:COX15/CtaA family protein [Georgfuchsia toluolica]CAG4883794.1 Heme A synthase, cytochrome oxidase biogenesis protein Cox15-CtaA [Georgfuchsia toluolica]